MTIGLLFIGGIFGAVILSRVGDQAQARSVRKKAGSLSLSAEFFTLDKRS